MFYDCRVPTSSRPSLPGKTVRVTGRAGIPVCWELGVGGPGTIWAGVPPPGLGNPLTDSLPSRGQRAWAVEPKARISSILKGSHIYKLFKHINRKQISPLQTLDSFPGQASAPFLGEGYCLASGHLGGKRNYSWVPQPTCPRPPSPSSPSSSPTANSSPTVC